MPPISTRLLRFAAVLAAFLPRPHAMAQAAEHPTLLPSVQQIHYGEGAVSLCGLILPAPTDPTEILLAELSHMRQDRCPSNDKAAIPLTLSIEDPNASPLPGPDDHAAPQSRESYSLSIRKDGIALHGQTSAGLFYAMQTLLQLTRNTEIPVVEIKDWPSLPYRGFMIDMSHGAILSVAEVERQLDALAQWKGNQYFFYVETDLDLKGYPLLHKPSNWSAQDIHTIVEYARLRHIDVVPCVELFGHLHDLFRIERYSSSAALPHGGEANPADPQAQAILEDWLRQYAALFPSPWMHLGFDEPFELERANSHTAGGVPPGTLWLQHLERMAHLASSLGKRPLFWADIDEGAYIFNKYPGLAAGLPKDAIAAPWFYDARPDYSNLLDLFSANRVPILVATGISDWDNIAPDFESTFINIDGFLAAGRKAQAIGMLNTEWSDSALALHREALPALAYGAIAAWQSAPVDRIHFFAEYSRIRYPASIAPKVSAALAHLTRAQALLRESLGSETSFRMFDSPFHPQTLARITQSKGTLQEAGRAAEDAEQSLIEASQQPEASSAKDDLDSLLVAARMLDYAAMKFVYATEIAANFTALPAHPTQDDVQYLLRRETAARNHSRVGDLIDISGELAQQYREEWLKQYKPYRLSTALARWQSEQTFWIHFQQNVWTITRDFKPGEPRPTLEQTLALY